MKKMASMILVGLIVLVTMSGFGLLADTRADRSTEWPFGEHPRDGFRIVPRGDIVVSIESTARTPGSAVLTMLGVAFRADPFFTRSMTGLSILPALTAEQFLQTGLRFDWWSASTNLALSLAPWALTSAGGWLEIHPPEWLILELPAVALGVRLGWGPQWHPVDEWTHAFLGLLNAQAAWALPTFWDNPLNVVVQSNLSGEWTLPDNDFVPQWDVDLDTHTLFPLLADSMVSLRAGAAARVSMFPRFGFGLDMTLELRANTFYAYGLVGASGTGVHAEIGATLSFGFSLFDGLSVLDEQE